jgi:hypothetical protein
MRKVSRYTRGLARGGRLMWRWMRTQVLGYAAPGPVAVTGKPPIASGR